MASNGSCFVVTWIVFDNHLLGARSNTKPGDRGIPNVHSRWFILFSSRVRTCMNRHSVK